MFLASGPDGDFNIATQSREKFHQASNGKTASAVPHQQGNLGLLHAENFSDLDLCHAAVLEDCVDLQRELRLEQFLLRIGEAKVCKDVAAAFGHAANAVVGCSSFGIHFSFAFLYSPARLPLAAV